MVPEEGKWGRPNMLWLDLTSLAADTLSMVVLSLCLSCSAAPSLFLFLWGSKLTQESPGHGEVLGLNQQLVLGTMGEFLHMIPELLFEGRGLGC